MEKDIALIVDACRKSVADGSRIILCGHDAPDLDSICSCILTKKLLKYFNIDSQIRIYNQADPDASNAFEQLGIDAGGYLGKNSPEDALFLLDHNVNSHSDGTRGVFFALDHHPVISISNYPVISSQKASSCTKMVFDYLDYLKIADEYDTKLAAYSVCYDTYAMSSTKTNPDDIPWFWAACERLGLDGNKISRESLCLDAPNGDPAKMCLYGFKKFGFPSGFIATSYAKSDTPELMPTEKMLEILKEKRVSGGYLLWEFMLCDPVHKKTWLYWIDCDGVHSEFCSHVVSRSREIIPRLSEMAKYNKYIKEDDLL